MFDLIKANETSDGDELGAMSKSTSGENGLQLLPSCIVIGCKNGNGKHEPNVKYCQVPLVDMTELNSPANNLAKQWYINTLREDLFDSMVVLSSKSGAKVANDPRMIHYVCIEHFDEESFLLTSMDPPDPETATISLKSDAVPSLFEIEVFQKMIAHQEKVAHNQQLINNQKQFLQQQAQAHSLSQQSSSSSQKPSLLADLITNKSDAEGAKKRQRIDPETRATLLERVPKAVKRTALLTLNHQPPKPVDQIKQQKAIKHTMAIMNRSSSSSTGSSSQILTNLLNEANNVISNDLIMLVNEKATAPANKAPIVNRQTVQQLKEILPPPIMQSTKQVKSTSSISINKAVKHTSALAAQPAPFPRQTLPNNPVVNNNNNNRITITTTYVYKRITNQPEIDLILDCEEEEYEYVKEVAPPPPPPPKPPTPPPPPAQEPDDSNPNKPVVVIETADREPVDVDEEKLKPVKKEPEPTATTTTNKISDECIEIHDDDDDIINDPDRIDIEQEVAEQKAPDQEKVTAKEDAVKPELVKEPPANASGSLQSELEPTLTELDRKINEAKLENKQKKLINNRTSAVKDNKQKPLKDQTKVAGKSQEDYSLVLAKYYSRRQGAVSLALQSKAKNNSKNVPHDLRTGKFPAKCNVCDLVLENNIELTSHICSHLEANVNNDSEMNTYISPFDAVTTICGLCEVTFNNPFNLIRHLDKTHMKQLAEYKCRICEKQHDKLNELLDHLNSEHSNQEMPYRCDACGFRTSFYADAIYHIKKEHTNTLRHFCPYCLKSLVLPYSKKSGHVQVSLFYAHLQTHFNKEESNKLVPSKCKHCQKCILHVRHMQEHLRFDHNVTEEPIANPPMNVNVKPQAHVVPVTKTSTGKKVGRPSRSQTPAAAPPASTATQNIPNKSAVSSATSTPNSAANANANSNYNLRKRKRSTSVPDRYKNFEMGDDAEDDTTPPPPLTEPDTPQPQQLSNVKDEYDFDSQEKVKPSTETSTTTTGTTGKKRGPKSKSDNKPQTLVGKQKQPRPIGKTDSLTDVKDEDATSAESVQLTTVIKNQPIKQQQQEQKENGEAAETVEEPVKPRRKQKALKQTTMKKFNGNRSGPGSSNINPTTGKRAYRVRTAANVDRGNSDDDDYDDKDHTQRNLQSNNALTTVFFGNVRFSCTRSQFKCIECGHSDLKSHYRNDYTCHQCHYNTSCSRSFEFHLHGHLVSKRVAMWNKTIPIEREEYKCPCGFRLQSNDKGLSTAIIGNKIAEHLLNCEYKYCSYKSAEEERRIAIRTENTSIDEEIKFESKKTDDDQDHTPNVSDAIIIDDSIEEIN